LATLPQEQANTPVFTTLFRSAAFRDFRQMRRSQRPTLPLFVTARVGEGRRHGTDYQAALNPENDQQCEKSFFHGIPPRHSNS
jgi:hypothetical protein